ncbi:cytochrome P450 6j1-like isoform X3 [Harmonia axyridis]|uniref:cytochrome P450 6j1-like isoform X3 n=1 Tax=Harmonia axyridis TaxID=115357 RepID=UPI001E277550|nr:cytochrome P450 6j1-like isoform X3 [Harmonia axyridis]
MHWFIEVLLPIAFLLYLLHLYISRNYDYWQKKNVPFIKPRPFVGNMGEVLLQKYNMGSFFEKLYNDMDAPFFGIFVFSKPALIVKDVKLLKNIFVKDFDHFMDRNTLAAEYDPVTAHMLFIEKGEEWKLMRSKISPFFSPSKLKAMFGAIDNLGVSLRRHIDASPNRSGLDVKELTSKFSVDVIAKCVFGIDAKSLEIEDGEFLTIAHKIFDTRPITSFRFLCYFFFHSFARIFRMKLFDADVVTFLRRVFWECIELREKHNVRGNDLIDIIVDLRKDNELSERIKFDGDKVIAQALLFFVAGFETTGSTIAFTLHALCLNLDIQRKLRENIRDIIKKHGGKLTMESIENMDYLDNVIKETLRKYSPVPIIDRVCTKDYKIPETDIVIEKGIITLVPPYGFQKDPKYFDNPEEYIPERFESIKEDMFYMPFGHGPRNCIEGDKVIAQALLFFVAGFETMGSTIAFTLHALCLNLDIQRKLREYIRDNIKKHGGKLTMESIENMVYLDNVVKETLRKYSPVPILDRVCTKDYKIPETDIVIEKGIITLVPPYGFQKDPKYFDNPEEYIPERFESIKEDMFYMPFGHGPRNCIGRRFGLIAAKLAILQILKEFELHSTDETPVNLEFSPASTIPQPIQQLKMSFINTDPLF